MHDNSLAAIAALQVVTSVSSSIGSNVSRLVTMLFHQLLYIQYKVQQQFSVIMIRSSNDESIMINHSEEQYFLMATTDPKEVKFVGWSNSCSQIQLSLQSQLLYKSMKQIMGLFLPSIVQQYTKVDYCSALLCSTKVQWYTTTAQFPSQYISCCVL